MRDFLLICFKKIPTERTSATELRAHPWLAEKGKFPSVEHRYAMSETSAVSVLSPSFTQEMLRGRSETNLVTKERALPELPRARASTSAVRGKHRFVGSNMEKSISCNRCGEKFKRIYICERKSNHDNTAHV